MSKREFLEAMWTARTELNEAISGFSEDQMVQDVVAGEWTVKDIMAHLAAWQNETLLAIERTERGDAGPIISEGVDEWNQRQVGERRHLPLADIMREFNDTHSQLLVSLDRWPEDHIPLGPGGWDETSRLWWLTEHDREHFDVIQAYRQRMDMA